MTQENTNTNIPFNIEAALSGAAMSAELAQKHANTQQDTDKTIATVNTTASSPKSTTITQTQSVVEETPRQNIEVEQLDEENKLDNISNEDYNNDGDNIQDDDEYEEDWDDDEEDDDEEGESIDEIISIIQEEEDADFLFEEGEYLAIPKIPEQYRASDIIGKRTQSSSASTAIKLGPTRPKSKLTAIWNELLCVEKYIMMLISEHRHMTINQLCCLIVTPSKHRLKAGAINNTKSYYEWVTKVKYNVSDMDYKETFKTKTPSGLKTKINKLCDKGLLERIVPAYSVDERNISDTYKEAPALFTEHYYLTPLGAKVLICNTAVNKPQARIKPVGFVPTYKNAAYQTILHEAESTEILCSIVSCSSYLCNPDDGHEYGFFDVCRFYHEKDIEEKKVVYRGKKIDFKTDGKLTIYVENIGDFLDWYIEYDSGSSTKDKIKHKTEAFIKYIFWQREKYGEKFRKPVLLLVTQKPADLFPQLTGKEHTTYTTAIKNMVKENFEEYLDVINDIAIILVADCGSIRTQGAMGACWHKVDLTTGIADTKAYDLIAASKGISQGIL